MDSELSDRELYLLRRLYYEARTGDYDHCIILQNLWNVYGVTFANKTLLYSALVFSSQRFQGGTVEILTLISKFNESLLNALQQNNISECHLFALLLFIPNATFFWDMMSYHHCYMQGCIEILKFLCKKSQGSTVGSLDYLYHFGYSILVEYQSCNKSTSLPYDLLQVAESLPTLNSLSDPEQLGAFLYESVPALISHMSKSKWSLWQKISIRYMRALSCYFPRLDVTMVSRFGKWSIILFDALAWIWILCSGTPRL